MRTLRSPIAVLSTIAAWLVISGEVLGVDVPCHKARWVEKSPYLPWAIFAAGNAAWHEDQWECRMPFVVFDDTGQWAGESGSSLEVDLPVEVKASPACVLDEAGYPVPATVHKVSGNKVSVTFMADVPAKSWRAYYLYLGAGQTPHAQTPPMPESYPVQGFKVVRMRLQRLREFPPTRVPRPGEDFFVGHEFSPEYLNKTLGGDPQRYVRYAKLCGGNLIQVWLNNKAIWASRVTQAMPGDLGRFIKEAHEHQVAVSLFGPHVPVGSESACANDPAIREFQQGVLEEIAKFPPDAIMLHDEGSVDGQDQPCKALFQQRLGYALPPSGDWQWWQKADLSDPKLYDLFRFKMDTYAEFVAWKSRLIRRLMPDVYQAIDFMPGQFPEGPSFYPGLAIDFDRLGDLGVHLWTDPYFQDGDARRYFLRLQRASVHNEMDAPTFIGVTPEREPGALERQAVLSLLYGGKSVDLWHLGDVMEGRKPRNPEGYYEACRNFLMRLRFCVGDLLAGAQPAKFAAIVWRRQAWLNHLRENSFAYDREVSNLANLWAFNWDYVLDKDWSKLSDYRVAIVPEDKFLGGEQAAALLAFAGKGGVLISSGAIQLRSGNSFQVVWEKERRVSQEGVLAHGKNTLPIPCWWKVEAQGGEVLGWITAGRERAPGIVSWKVGQGRLVYLACSLSQLLTSSQEQTNRVLAELVSRYCRLPVVVDGAVEPVLYLGQGYRVVGLANLESGMQRVRVTIPGITETKVYDATNCREVRSASTDSALSFQVKLAVNEVGFYQIVPSARVVKYPLRPVLTRNDLAVNQKPRPLTIRPWVAPPYLAEADRAAKSGKVTVGVLSQPDSGAEGICEALALEPTFCVVKLPPEDVDRRVLRHFKVFILPNQNTEIPSIAADPCLEIQRYVRDDGGGVLLTHFSCGGAMFAHLLFPEIATGKGKVNSSTARLTGRAHPIVEVFAKDADYKHMYWDHVTLQQGHSGVPLLKDEAGNVILVAGSVGTGKVVCSGMLFGWDSPPDKVTKTHGWSRQLLLRTLNWLGGGK